MSIRSNLDQYAENETGEQFTRQNSKLLKIELAEGGVHAKRGSMVAYQGDVKFENKGSGGIGKMLKKAVTNEGADMMHANGTGELFIADDAKDVHIMYLDNDSMSVNGSNILAFNETISWDIKRLSGGAAGAMAGGLYNMELSGTGFVAITTDGPPVMLDVASSPTFGDAQAVVMWSGGVQMQLKTDTGGLKSIVRGGSGETFQMAFGGQGFVLVQPSEGPRVANNESAGGGGGLLGQVLGK
jgi:uncharacterized protein (AIM24 family)